jgi:hypothetical protein
MLMELLVGDSRQRRVHETRGVEDRILLASHSTDIQSHFLR